MKERGMSPIETLAVDIRTVARMFGVTRSTIYRGIQNGTFPKPTIRMGTMSPRWSVAELKAFAEKGGAIHGK